MSSRAAALAVVLFAAPVSAVAAAATPSGADKAEARRRFEVGVADAKAGAYREAIAEFMRAYELSPNFAVLYNVAMAHAALADAAAALATYERYIAEGGNKIPPDRRAKVAAEMKQLLARTGSIVVRVSPQAARLTLDGSPLDAAVTTRGVRANVGVHRLAATLDGYVSAEQAITVDSNGIVNVTLALSRVPEAVTEAPPPAPPPSAPPAAAPVKLTPTAQATSPVMVDQRAAAPIAADRSSGSLQRTMGFLIGGAGVVGLAISGALYYRARSQAQSAIDNMCTQDLDTCQGDGRRQWLDSQSGITNSRIAAAIGGGLLAAGGVLVLMAPSSPGAPGGVALVGRF